MESSMFKNFEKKTSPEGRDAEVTKLRRFDEFDNDLAGERSRNWKLDGDRDRFGKSANFAAEYFRREWIVMSRSSTRTSHGFYEVETWRRFEDLTV